MPLILAGVVVVLGGGAAVWALLTPKKRATPSAETQRNNAAPQGVTAPPAPPPGGFDLGGTLKTVGGIIGAAGAVGGALGLGGGGAAAAGTAVAGGGAASASLGASLAPVMVVAGPVAAAAVTIAVVVWGIVLLANDSARLAKGRPGAVADLLGFARGVRDALEPKLREARLAPGRERVVASLFAFEFALCFNGAARSLVAATPKSAVLNAEQHLEFWADRALFVTDDFMFAPTEADPSPGLPLALRTLNARAIRWDARWRSAVEAELFRDLGGTRAAASATAGNAWTKELRAAAGAQGRLSFVQYAATQGFSGLVASWSGIGGEFSLQPMHVRDSARNCVARGFVGAALMFPSATQATHLVDLGSALALNLDASEAQGKPVLEVWR